MFRFCGARVPGRDYRKNKRRTNDPFCFYGVLLYSYELVVALLLERPNGHPAQNFGIQRRENINF